MSYKKLQKKTHNVLRKFMNLHWATSKAVWMACGLRAMGCTSLLYTFMISLTLNSEYDFHLSVLGPYTDFHPIPSASFFIKIFVIAVD